MTNTTPEIEFQDSKELYQSLPIVQKIRDNEKESHLKAKLDEQTRTQVKIINDLIQMEHPELKLTEDQKQQIEFEIKEKLKDYVQATTKQERKKKKPLLLRFVEAIFGEMEHEDAKKQSPIKQFKQEIFVNRSTDPGKHHYYNKYIEIRYNQNLNYIHCLEEKLERNNLRSVSDANIWITNGIIDWAEKEFEEETAHMAVMQRFNEVYEKFYEGCGIKLISKKKTFM